MMRKGLALTGAFAIIVITLLGAYVAITNRPASTSSTAPGAAPTGGGATAYQATARPTPSAPIPAPVLGMTAAMGRAQTMRIRFSGSDSGGSLSFDVTADSVGGLRGHYVRQGAQADVLLVAGTLYMRGHAAVAAFTHLPVPNSATGWVRIPQTLGLGILGTIATPATLQDCLLASAHDLAPTGTHAVDTATGTEFSPVYTYAGRTTTLPWEFVVDNAPPGNLLAWQVVGGPSQLPSSCGNVKGSNQLNGTTGIFTFSEFGDPVAPATAPAGAATPAPAVSDGDPPAATP